MPGALWGPPKLLWEDASTHLTTILRLCFYPGRDWWELEDTRWRRRKVWPVCKVQSSRFCNPVWNSSYTEVSSVHLLPEWGDRARALVVDVKIDQSRASNDKFLVFKAKYGDGNMDRSKTLCPSSSQELEEWATGSGRGLRGKAWKNPTEHAFERDITMTPWRG